MTRKLRIDPLDGWHHVMNRGVDRHRIFFDAEGRIEFGRCVAVACRRFGVEVHAYCLMDNHFHLLLRCPQGHLSDVMHLACGLYASFVNRRHRRVGHLFGDRFCSRLVSSDEYIAVAVRYIHRNALDVRGVERCGDYRWSSHRTYLGDRSPADFIRTDHVLRWFDNRAAFGSFVDGTMRPRSVDALVAASDIDVDVCHVLAAADMAISQCSTLTGRAVLAQRRAVLLELAQNVDPGLLTPIVSELGIETKGALKSAVSRGRRHFVEHPENQVILVAAMELIPGDTTLDLAS